MSAPMPEVLGRWLTEVRALAVSLTGDAAKDADANMLVFYISDAQASGVSSEQLDDFLMRAYAHFAQTLPPQGLWFYAWYDEMSGTLRTSVCQASGVTELPFVCRLDVVTTPGAVTAAALGSPYSEGIPANELVPEEEWDGDDDREFVLTVFARPVIVVSQASPHR